MDVSLKGTSVEPDTDDMEAAYGEGTSPADVLQVGARHIAVLLILRIGVADPAAWLATAADAMRRSATHQPVGCMQRGSSTVQLRAHSDPTCVPCFPAAGPRQGTQAGTAAVQCTGSTAEPGRSRGSRHLKMTPSGAAGGPGRGGQEGARGQ